MATKIEVKRIGLFRINRFCENESEGVKGRVFIAGRYRPFHLVRDEDEWELSIGCQMAKMSALTPARVRRSMGWYAPARTGPTYARYRDQTYRALRDLLVRFLPEDKIPRWLLRWKPAKAKRAKKKAAKR